MPMKDNLEKYHITITKEELASKACVNYSGGAEVIDSMKGFDEAMQHLENAGIIGFDTETRPSFKRGVAHTVALMQLASSEKCFLFRLNKIGIPPRLRSFLENPDIPKIGLSLHDDFHNLRNLSGDLEPQGFTDLQNYVKQFRIADNSLTKIYCVLFGKRISKGQRLTNWEAESLTEAQINYAAYDAIACIKIYDYLRSGQFRPEENQYFRLIEEPESQATDASSQA